LCAIHGAILSTIKVGKGPNSVECLYFGYAYGVHLIFFTVMIKKVLTTNGFIKHNEITLQQIPAFQKVIWKYPKVLKQLPK
jgi:hypothetical protein